MAEGRGEGAPGGTRPESLLVRDRRTPERFIHPSTQRALAALAYLAESGYSPDSMLDMGCGGGLLSLFAAKQWPGARLTACDISAQAVQDTKETFRLNHMETRIQVLRSDGYSHAEIRKCGPYALIVANLLAEWHIRFAAEALLSTQAGGVLILAGILPWLEQGVRAAYPAMQWQEFACFATEGNWLTLVLQRCEALSID